MLFYQKSKFGKSVKKSTFVKEVSSWLLILKIIIGVFWAN